jgi:hypothetical protein
MPKPTDVNLNNDATTRSFGKKGADQVSDLILLLYEGRITYGEFAKKRHEVAVASLEQQRAWKRTLQIADQVQRERDQQSAMQQQAINAQVWSAYMGAQGVTCTTNKIGNTATTNCR